MEIIDNNSLREVPMFYKGYSSLKKAVKFESVNYMLRLPTDKEFDGVAVTHGVANYLYSKLAHLFSIEHENVKLVNYENVITSMCRDFEVDANSKLYTMEDINGRFDLSSSMDIYNIMDVCSIIDETHFSGEFTLLKRFMEIVVLDFITGNSSRRLNGYGILTSHRTFVNLAPIFGGACAFDSGLKKETVSMLVSTNEYERRARQQEFNYLKCNDERIAPYAFVVRDKGISYDVVQEFLSINESEVYNLVNGLSVIDERTKLHIINMILIRIDMLSSI